MQGGAKLRAFKRLCFAHRVAIAMHHQQSCPHIAQCCQLPWACCAIEPFGGHMRLCCMPTQLLAQRLMLAGVLCRRVLGWHHAGE